jgi:hypothetical protein
VTKQFGFALHAFYSFTSSLAITWRPQSAPVSPHQDS